MIFFQNRLGVVLPINHLFIVISFQRKTNAPRYH